MNKDVSRLINQALAALFDKNDDSQATIVALVAIATALGEIETHLDRITDTISDYEDTHFNVTTR